MTSRLITVTEMYEFCPAGRTVSTATAVSFISFR